MEAFHPWLKEELNMRSSAHIGKHPIHPMLIVFPIALFIAAFVFDLVYLSTRNPLWYRIAYYNILLGVISALLAAVAGFVDYFTLPMSDKARSTATTHMLLNLLVVVLFVINLIIRYDDAVLAGSRLTWMIILDVVAVALLSYAGWLGGELVYRHGLGVILPDVEAEEQALQSRRPGTSGMEPGFTGS
jgi:uncharacterized membrane protein